MGWATFEEEPPDPSRRFSRAEWEKTAGSESLVCAILGDETSTQ